MGCSSPPAYPWPALEDLPLAQSRESTRLVLQHTPRSLSTINGHKAQSPQITLVEVQISVAFTASRTQPAAGLSRAACAKCRPCPCARHRLRSAGSVIGWCRVPCLPLPRLSPTGPFPPSVCFRRRRRRRHGRRAVVRVKAPSSVSVRWRERGREGRKVVALAGRGDVVGGCAPHNVSEQAVSSDKQQQARDGPVPTRHYGSSVTDCGRTMNSE
mgnify:CR=1 FL=1